MVFVGKVEHGCTGFGVSISQRTCSKAIAAEEDGCKGDSEMWRG